MEEIRVRQLYNDMNVHNSVFIIGAGTSFDMGLPLYAQFPEMIWKVLDEFPELKVEMGYSHNISAKICIGSDINVVKNAFTYIEQNPKSCYRFKSIFRSICAEHSRMISNVHRIICRLIHENKIKLVISLNWDDLLEQAWEELYGTGINSEFIQLIKPHGDVRKMEQKWIFPNSSGYVSQENLDTIYSIINEKPITLVILGYSESDATIVNNIIEPINNVSKTYRIAPNENATIKLTAKEAMQILEKYCNNLDNEWKHLNYKKRNGMERALLGYRLTPADVENCSKFSCAQYAKHNLQLVNYTIIQSEPGYGKSITAYQVAYDYMLQGWEVVLYRSQCNSKIQMLETRYRTVFIIDDAQQFSDVEIEDVICKADDRHKVIITKTLSDTAHDGTITISNKQAVKEIKKFYLENENRVINILNSFNSREKIGNLYMQKPLSLLLDRAEHEKSPWLFNYVLRGGWEKIKQEYINVRDLQNGEYTFFVISVLQIISLDKEILIEDIVELNQECFEVDYDKTLSDIDFLRRNRLIVGEERIRTLHLEMASRVIMLSYSAESKKERQKFVDCIRHEFMLEKTSLLGRVWLTNLTFAYNSSMNFHSEIYTDVICDLLVKRCFCQVDAEKKRDAGYLLELVVRNNARYSYQFLLENYGSELQKMIEETNLYSVWSNRDICNSMYNESPNLKLKFVSGLDLSGILIRIKEINQETLYGWAAFLDRLLIGQSKKWHNSFFKKIPLVEVCNVLRTVSMEKISSLCKMMWVLYCCNKEFARYEYYNILPIIVNGLKKSFIETLREIDLNFKMAFWGEGLFERGRKNKEQKRALSTLCEEISENIVVKAIENGKPRDWKEIFCFIDQMEVVDHVKVRKIIKAIDYNKLERVTEGLWEEQPEDLQYLLLMIVAYDKKKVEQLICNHLVNFKKMKSSVAVCAPKIACHFVSEGGQVELYEQWYSWGGIPIELLKQVYNIEKSCFEKIVIDNQQIIFKRFINCEPIHWSENSELICLLCEKMPGIVEQMLQDLDVSDIQEKWRNNICNENNLHHRDKNNCKSFIMMLQAICQITHNKELKFFLEKVIVQMLEQLEKTNVKQYTFTLHL